MTHIQSCTREKIIAKFFFDGYRYETITQFVYVVHGIVLSVRQLKRILRARQLQRRQPHTQFHNNVIIYLIQVKYTCLTIILFVTPERARGPREFTRVSVYASSSPKKVWCSCFSVCKLSCK